MKVTKKKSGALDQVKPVVHNVGLFRLINKLIDSD